MANSRPQLVIEDSNDRDIAAIQAIFAYSVLHEVGTFREEPLTEERVAEVRREVRALGLPHLVARLVPVASGENVEAEVVGFTYAAPFRPFGAYRFTVEDSVYVKNGHRGQGVGRALLAELLGRLERAQVVASPSSPPASGQTSDKLNAQSASQSPPPRIEHPNPTRSTT